MLHLLAVVVPLGLSAAVSPVMLSEQVVVLGSPRGRRAAALYALGTAVVLALVVLASAVLGRSIRLPSAPHLDATGDLVLGAALLVMALALRRHRSRPATPRPPRGPMSPPVAFGFGMVSMATNATTLALVLVAVKDVTASGRPDVEQAAALALLVVLGTAPAWFPVLLAALPGRSAQALGALSDAVSRHAKGLAVLILLVVGGFLVVRGVVRLAGL
jgi:threonine/homoserine/homoserine lactone efflux protein